VKVLRSKMDQSPQATLQNLDLWEKFVSLPNEMVVTSKKGRNMFPIVKVMVSGLEPKSLYKMKLEFIQGKQRYSYFNGEWHKKGNAEALKGLKGKKLKITQFKKRYFIVLFETSNLHQNSNVIFESL
jgi:hypothetical protein